MRPAVLPPAEIANRLRAARALADLSVEALADRLGPGLSAKTIGNMEREQRPARTQDLRAIAHACDLPYEFFTVDFKEALGGVDLSSIEKLVRALTERVDAQQEDLEELRLSLGLDALADAATQADAPERQSVPASDGKDRPAPRTEAVRESGSKPPPAPSSPR